MTAIVGFTDGKKVWMGGDSAGTAGTKTTLRKDEKVFINGDFLIGFCGSFRMGQLLRYSFSPPAKKEGQDLYAYMVTDFVDAVRACLKQGGYARADNGEEQGGLFLVGHKGRLFEIECDYQVGESFLAYEAIGCGEEVARGVMYATEGKAPKERIELALSAAEQFSAAVRAPFTILEL